MSVNHNSRIPRASLLSAIAGGLSLSALGLKAASGPNPHYTRRRVRNPAGAKLLRKAFKIANGRRGTYEEAVEWCRLLRESNH